MGSNIQALRQQIQVLKEATIGPQAMSRRIAEVAEKAITDLEARQGKYPREQFVDGRRGAPLNSVRPDGVVEFHISVLDDVIDDVYAALVERAPIKDPSKKRGHPSRFYLEHIWLFVNGQRIQGDGAGVQIKPTDVVVLIDVAPYARRVEFGMSKRQAPSGVFELVARQMARKWSNVCKITFDYRGCQGAPPAEGIKSKGALKYPSIEIGPW